MKIKEIEIQGYYFTNIDNLYFHSGYFYYLGKKCKIVCNNGSKSVLLPPAKKLGVKKLRKYAKPCVIKLENYVMPF